MLSGIREKVIGFMENDKNLSKLKGDKWYEMEDKLVALCEEVSGRKDTTYESPRSITENWVGGIADEDEIDGFVSAVSRLEEKAFGNFIRLVNGYFGALNTDGEIDGLAVELEELFEGGQE